MQVLVIQLIENFFREVFKDVHTTTISSITGPLIDSTTVAIPTFLAGVLGGPIGAVLGACIGTTFLGVSKAKGVNHYKPLLTALEEDFTEQERQQLYERVWGRLQGFVTSPLTQSLIYVALNELSTAAQFNPNVLDNIRNEINKTLRMRSMTLG